MHKISWSFGPIWEEITTLSDVLSAIIIASALKVLSQTKSPRTPLQQCPLAVSLNARRAYHYNRPPTKTSIVQHRNVLCTVHEVARTRSSFGNRSLTVTGPRLWNSLPLHLWFWTYSECWSSAVAEDAPILLRTAASIATVAFGPHYKSTLFYLFIITYKIITLNVWYTII